MSELNVSKHFTEPAEALVLSLPKHSDGLNYFQPNHPSPRVIAGLDPAIQFEAV